MGDFKKLAVWHETQKLVDGIYRLTRGFPKEELYGLRSQMRRAAISVAAHLAKGCGRQGDPELRRFIRISLGSLAELECELLLAEQLNFLNSEETARIVSGVHLIRRMLQRLHSALP